MGAALLDRPARVSGSNDELRAAVEGELSTLASRVVGWSAVRWAAPAQHAPGTPAHGWKSRKDAGRQLCLTLALLGAAAGSGAPPGVEPPLLSPAAFGDQWLVLGRDLLGAPWCERLALTAALSALLVTRTALDGSAPPPALARLAGS